MPRVPKDCPEFNYILKKEERKLEKEGVRVCICECLYETHLRGRGRSLIWPLTYYAFGVNREGCAAEGTAFSGIPPCRELPCAAGLWEDKTPGLVFTGCEFQTSSEGAASAGRSASLGNIP